MPGLGCCLLSGTGVWQTQGSVELHFSGDRSDSHNKRNIWPDRVDGKGHSQKRETGWAKSRDQDVVRMGTHGQTVPKNHEQRPEGGHTGHKEKEPRLQGKRKTRERKEMCLTPLWILEGGQGEYGLSTMLTQQWREPSITPLPPSTHRLLNWWNLCEDRI